MEVLGPYLTSEDVDYILAAAELGLHDFVLPFTEKPEDITTILDLDPHAKVWLKLDSAKGFNFVKTTLPTLPFASAVRIIVNRPEILTCYEDKTDIIEILQYLIRYDKKVVANVSFSSLLKGTLSQGDLSDVHLLRTLGYRNFVLTGPVCIDQKGMAAVQTVWNNYCTRYPLT
eukprot:TRINITY_DN1265_c0_g1_i10.p1 TRINITY_DN1265_c0_g1~~TRINITY_DN1265_c0_g1_i10.p1  ORF type:complete len:173 (+),score=41.64 TRINITY_DN1265_c0_g1_i10:344-862(+)